MQPWRDINLLIFEQFITVTRASYVRNTSVHEYVIQINGGPSVEVYLLCHNTFLAGYI